ncbi:MAG: 3-hydroxyisobutyrate dehydrogenase [Rhizobiales bacterium]|nr:3-hydroxyisobutyrate dehydrogenase [Hyphomicrobiales bacterium]
MAQIGFVGLGNMGLPMARNLIRAGHAVTGYDLNIAASDKFAAVGGVAATALDMACMGADVVITMLPARKEVREAYLARGGILASAPEGALLVDASSVDVETARAVAAAAQVNELSMVDAPVSGGVPAAEAGSLTFMVGGSDRTFERAKPILEAMGTTIFHAGGVGDGQAVKICNNMILGVSMIAVAEAFLLANKLGIDPQTLFDIASKASGQCWAMTSCCPVPGPVPSAPANYGYQAGLTAAMMLKDLKLAQEAAKVSGAKSPIGAAATALYALYVEQGSAQSDFSGIIQFLRGPEKAKDQGMPVKEAANN